ncbi:MAG: thiamine pyrophosphate-dependent enzyme [candidate division SR1 bacterium]|nr:thiamine pyrophosphate-dependent enzyme [candidate division SR1 bacterium]
MRAGLNKIQRCPGCGNFIINAAIKNALKELGIPKHKVVIVSGVGCSGKTSQYIDSYGAETLHGRAVPFATGLKLANPDLTVIIYGGDGDGYGIGLGHFLHACRRNTNLTYIVANNENYGLTTGQASPTTPLHVKTKSTPEGNTLLPFDPNALAKAAGCQYSVHVIDKDIALLTQAIVDGIKHEGFSHIDVDQGCPSWKKW